MLRTTRLTKRQKKGIAFRARKHGERKDNPLGNLEDEVDDSSFEDQVLVDATQGQQGPQAIPETLVGEGEAGAESDKARARQLVAERKGKRKVDEEEERTVGGSDQRNRKRRKGSDGRPLESVEEHVEDHVGAGGAGKESEKTKQRFILFLGNLKYTTTLEAIQAHFSVCVPPPAVRLLTPKPSTKSSIKTAVKSKGCAFLEFKHRGALQQGLKLHHSQLDGRQINLELTAGGGGKGVTRMKKLKERNRELEGQRKQKDPGVDAKSRDARFSVTSSAEQTRTHETAGDTRGSETHRNQKRQRGYKRREPQTKDFRTGVNAIPVG